ncbi:sortase domain-bontaining protein [Agrilactobacillus yilanensis]|uniref:Sortase domain-bontaining protein n=1 Tax=Agrilactobacillus yilanensis TaxID=2485997 RepID=A0ABW4J5E1_9LACO|nr:sortase [Agrilactobacillus yilanensis]
MKSDLAKVIGLVVASATALSLSSAVILNQDTSVKVSRNDSTKVVSAATLPSGQRTSLLNNRVAFNSMDLFTSSTTETQSTMFSNGQNWLKLGYNQWEDTTSEQQPGYQEVAITDTQLEMSSGTTAAVVQDATAEAKTPTVMTTQAREGQTQTSTAAVNVINKSAENQPASVQARTTDQQVAAVSQASTANQAASTSTAYNGPATDTLKIAGYTVRYQDNVADTPNVNDGSNYRDTDLQGWLNKQTAGVWNINANANNHINDQAAPEFSTTDNKNSYFIGHNVGAFTPLMKVNVGNIITATDSNNNTKNYQIAAIYRLPASNSGNQWIDLDTGQNVFDNLYAGNTEKITLQTCIDEYSIRIVVANGI